MHAGYRLVLALAVPTLFAGGGLIACGGAQQPPTSTPTSPPSTTSPPNTTSTSTTTSTTTSTSIPTSPPTLDEARAFLTRVDADLRDLWTARDRAGWVAETFITDDTEALAARTEQATAEYITKTVHEAQRFSGMQLPEDLARQLLLLRLSQVIPAPIDPAKASDLAAIGAAMTGAYGKGQTCPAKGSKLARFVKKGERCLHLDDLDRILSTSRDPAVLTEAWNRWYETARPQRERYVKYVALANEGARELGFPDVGAMWRSAYDMKPEEFGADLERLWSEVKPLYEELHCYVRARLRAKYGKAVPEHGPLPMELTGNMWGQSWEDIYDLVEPYKGEPSIDVSKTLEAKKIDAKSMVRLGESFFTSLGFDPLPASFWERSQLTRPRDREVVCHASASDVTWSDDLRVKVCLMPTEDDLVTIHHELGHDFYFSQYYKQPILFQQGANDGFHEGIGDTIALSVTPAYLKERGLLSVLPKGDKSRINEQMKMALQKVAFLPFALRVDKWRWDVFSGKVTPDRYNAAWWDGALKYQGVVPPEPRTEDDFDPAAKFHVASSVPYARYFLSFIYQFQFHRALCKAAEFTGPLDQCSIYESSAAGQKLRAMLAMGASKPWQEAMEALSGEREGDAGAILEYFAPLRAWLKDEIKDEKCGW
jgi:peptidyl-dipeptidase A